MQARCHAPLVYVETCEPLLSNLQLGVSDSSIFIIKVPFEIPLKRGRETTSFERNTVSCSLPFIDWKTFRTRSCILWPTTSLLLFRVVRYIFEKLGGILNACMLFRRSCCLYYSATSENKISFRFPAHRKAKYSCFQQ